MIDVKSAVAKAIEFLSDVLKSDDIVGIKLEEVELSDDHTTWDITLSFVRCLPDVPDTIGRKARRPRSQWQPVVCRGANANTRWCGLTRQMAWCGR